MSQFKSDLSDVDVYVHHRTPAAVLVSDDGERDNAVWLPLSQIEIDDTPHGEATVTAPEWLLRDKGLI